MKDLFLVFEPINHAYKVVEAAARRGYDVVAFHSRPLPTEGPYARGAAALSARHAVASWSHEAGLFERVVRECAGRRVVGTYAPHEVTLEFEARVQEHFGLPTKGSARIASLLDKVTVRRTLSEQGLTRLAWLGRAEVDALTAWPVPGRALFFKPIRGAGSAYVTRCRTLDEVRAAIAFWDAAGLGCRDLLREHLDAGGGFFLEEEAPGELLSVEGYSIRGAYHVLGVTSRTVLERDVAVEMGATFPYRHPRHEEIVDKVRRIHRALGIPHGPTHTEVVVPAEGEIELVELNLRFVGADVLLLMNEALGVDVADALVALAVGERPALAAADAPRQYACLQYLLAPSGLRRLESIEYPPGGVLVHRQMKPLGAELRSTDFQIDQIAGFIVSDATYAAALERAMDVRRAVRVNGRPLGDDPNNVVVAR